MMQAFPQKSVFFCLEMTKWHLKLGWFSILEKVLNLGVMFGRVRDFY